MDLAWERRFRRRVEEEGMGWEVVRYPRPEADGEARALRLTPAAAPRGVVVVSHGAGNDALFSFVSLFRRLLLAGYEVFSWELDGHGRGGDTRFGAEAAPGSVAEAVRRSGAAERGLPTHALGVSLGGAVLLSALPSLSDTLRSAALLVAPLEIRFSARALRRELGLPLLRTLWRERQHYGALGLVPSFGPWKREIYPLRLADAPPPGSFGYVQLLNDALRRLRLEEAARRTRTPVLLVYAGRDLLVPPAQGERLATLIPGARLLRLPRETHLTAPLAPEAVEGVVDWVGREE